MTVAVSVKVFDGVVLAAESATTLPLRNESGEIVSAQVYNSANKIFHLHRRLPIGAATWGLGSIGSGSIAGLAKDLRSRLMGAASGFEDWELDEDSYTIEDVAERLVEFFFDELYSAHLAGTVGQELGFVLAGYGGQSHDAELWQIVLVDPTKRPEPLKLASGDQAGWVAFAQSNATNRLFRGYDDGRYQLGPDTVGGPIEAAGISRHEGFKWVSRKHYFDMKLNPNSGRIRLDSWP